MSKGPVMSFNILSICFIATRALTIVAVCSINQGHAADRLIPQDKLSPRSDAAIRSLRPEQINAIRFVGRNILTAKRHGQDNTSDQEQLTLLKEGIDSLIKAEMSAAGASAISAKTEESNIQLSLGKQRKASRDSALNSVRTIGQSLRAHNSVKYASEISFEVENTLSAGLPIGKQRTDMFEKWADKLDAALAEDDENRLSRFQVLRAQLQSADLNHLNAPIKHGTPTIQAMPSDYLPPNSTGNSTQEPESKD